MTGVRSNDLGAKALLESTSPIPVKTNTINPLPSQYAQLLYQFADKKLKAMQDAFFAGNDLAPYLEPKVFRSFSGGNPLGAPIRIPAHAQILAYLTTGVCWSLAAPDILKPVKTNTAGTVVQKNARHADAVRAPAGLLDNVVQGECHKLQGWMKEWKGSSEHEDKIKTAILTPAEELACNKHGVEIIGHADFGLKRVGWSSTDIPAIPYERPVPRYFRTLNILNEGSKPVVLLDVCGVPSIDQTFMLHDDCRLAHHYDVEQNQQSGYDASFGVTIQAGAQYQVTVELRCSQEDIAWHQQWLLFVFTDGNALESETQKTFVIGRRVSALIGGNIQDVQRCLSTEARPFYPAALRCLFDCNPLTYEVARDSLNGNGRNWRMQFPAFCQTHVLSVWPQQLLYLEEALQARASLPPSSSPRSCDCNVQQLRQLSRLLALEEAAMERDIKEYDLFNVQLVYLEPYNFTLEVPGLPENRPSVFAEDFVYIRLERDPQIECAAEVVAVEFQPKPRLILKLPPAFTSSCPSSPTSMLVHVRFTFDRLVLIRMHSALVKVALSPAKLLPCTCSKGRWSESNKWTMSPPVHGKSNSFTLPATSDALLELPKMINKCLNIEQWKAVENIVDHARGPGPYIILGPPGTGKCQTVRVWQSSKYGLVFGSTHFWIVFCNGLGKTITCVECVLQLLSRDPSARVCVCAPSNYAADILCSGIAAGGIDPKLMWRMNDPRRTMASIKVDVLPFCKFRFLSIRSDEKLSFKVIVCTCGAAGMLTEPPLLGRLVTLTHVLIDEAGQALIPEALIPLSLGDSNTCYVLCGDPKQLGPVVHSKSAAENGLDESLIGRFHAAGEDSFKPGGAISSTITKLVRNYRANGKLLELPSRLFYNNELIASAPASTIAPPQDWEELKGRDFPMLFYGVKGWQMREGESPSYFNPVEAGKVVDLITGLISRTQITAGDIGVMAPYRRQVQKLRLVLRSRKLGAVRVGTVDDYQGQEEKVVFISTVLTRPESLKQVKASGKHSQIGFLSNAKRFNVAITRAKTMLVVVGHPLVLASDENWSELLRFCLARDAFRGYGSEFIVPAFDPHEYMPEVDVEDDDVRNRRESVETAKAIEKMAELSLLGMGDVDRMYPVGLDSMYSAFSEDTEWRIQL